MKLSALPEDGTNCMLMIETTEWGSRLPDKTYYPMYLSNGTDGMLINILGSGVGWFELSFDYSVPLTGQKAAGWYKSDRRTHHGLNLAYGAMKPLFEFSAAPILNGDRVVPRNCKQYFDPRRAVLTSFYEQMDHDTLEWMKVKVTTFLTRDHVLVEHYEFEEAPVDGASIRFFMNSPSEAYLHLYERVLKMDQAGMEVDVENSLMRYEFAHDGWSGGAVSWMDCSAENGSTRDNGEEIFVHGNIQTVRHAQGESFTRYLAAIDSEDASDYAEALKEVIGKCALCGYHEILRQHEEEWNTYHGSSRMEIPEKGLSYLYDVSRYLIRSNLHPSGFLPMGTLPYLWQGVMFWDAGFATAAFIGNGNLAEAESVLDNLRTYQREGREAARRFDAKGMRLEWTVEREKFTRYPRPNSQVHNNAWWAHMIYSYYEATGDQEFLRRNLEIMGELLLFLTDRFVEDRGDHAIISQCLGVDESFSNPKTNDTWTAAITLKALTEYREATQLLRVESLIEDLSSIIARLQVGLDQNVDADGVMQSFLGGKLPHWGSLIFDLFPDHPSRRATLHRMMENYDPEMNLHNFHGVTRYAEKAFPWADYWAARCFARGGDCDTHYLLDCVAGCVNYFGGIPERVFYHGELFNNWFLSAHASLVWAVNGMLANAHKGVLRILCGSQERWKDVCFEGIFAGEGLVVSARMSNEQVTSLRIENLLPDLREIQCVIGDRGESMTLSLIPGHNDLDVMINGKDSGSCEYVFSVNE